MLVGVDLKTTMDMDDYESLPPSTPLYVSCTAGALAGVAEHCAMFPVDSVKVCYFHKYDNASYSRISLSQIYSNYDVLFS